MKDIMRIILLIYEGNCEVIDKEGVWPGGGGGGMVPNTVIKSLLGLEWAI